jgi:hypothetical protein
MQSQETIINRRMTMTKQLKPGDTVESSGKLYRVYDDGQRLRLWLISQPAKRMVAIGNQDGITEVAQEFDEQLQALREQDAGYYEVDSYNFSNEWGW